MSAVEPLRCSDHFALALDDLLCRNGVALLNGCRRLARWGAWLRFGNRSAAFSAEFFTRLIGDPTLWTGNARGCAVVRTELGPLPIIAAAFQTARTSPLNAVISPGHVDAFIQTPSLRANRLSPCDR
jgi:hypothetical protein